jgi:hypothetical protein
VIRLTRKGHLTAESKRSISRHRYQTKAGEQRYTSNATPREVVLKAGIWIDGQYDLGLDLENNNIKLNRGAKIFFDENQTRYLWLNPSNSRLEFKYLDNVLGYLTLGSLDHEL